MPSDGCRCIIITDRRRPSRPGVHGALMTEYSNRFWKRISFHRVWGLRVKKVDVLRQQEIDVKTSSEKQLAKRKVYWRAETVYRWIKGPRLNGENVSLSKNFLVYYEMEAGWRNIYDFGTNVGVCLSNQNSNKIHDVEPGHSKPQWSSASNVWKPRGWLASSYRKSINEKIDGVRRKATE